MKYSAFWISIKGKIIPVPQHHIDLVIQNPELFNLTSQEIEKKYEKHKEPLHLEGYAREEIMGELIAKGWIRLRYVPKRDSWTIQLHVLDKDLIKRIKKWYKDTLQKGQIGKTMGVVLKNEKGQTLINENNYMTLDEIPFLSSKVQP